MSERDYVADSERLGQLMAIYRQLKTLASNLKVMDVRAWKYVDICAAKILRYARKEKKQLKEKRVRK